MKRPDVRYHTTVRAIPAVKVDTKCPTPPEPIQVQPPPDHAAHQCKDTQ
jgi:hypothetical protein